MSNNPRQVVYAGVLASQDGSVLNADTIMDQSKAAGIIYTNGVGSRSAGGFFDALSEISSTDTKTTTIVIEQNAGTRPTRDNVTQYGFSSLTFTITVDWVNLEVTWIGLSDASVANGRSNIQSNGSSVNLSSWGNLVTGPNRKILGLPFYGRAPVNTTFARSTYAITTDTGINVTAAPTPPAETPTVAPVVGVKISELNAATSLTDTDLFVLSRDDPAGAPYDKSLNVTLENLKASIEGLFAPAITDSDVMSVLAQRDAAFSGTVSLTPPTDKKFAILSCQLDCDAGADAGGNWFLVIGKNLDTDLPAATYPAGVALPVAAQLAEIYKYSVAETSTVPGTDPNATDTNLRYVYVGDGGTVSIPWRVLIMVGPSGAVAVTITVVGWV
jgi:hypothetical protein